MEERWETNPRVNFLINIAYWAVIVAIIFLVFKYLINIMMPIFLAFIFAAVVRPISRALSRETRYVRGKDGNKVLVKRKFHMNRNVAGIISVLVLFIVVGGLLTLIVVRLTDTIVDFVSFAPTFYEQSVLPGITKLYNWVLEVGERFDVSIMDAIEQALPGMISNLGSAVTNLSGKIVSGVTGAIIAIRTAAIPKLLPEQWARSKFKVPQGVLNFWCFIALCGSLFSTYMNASSLDTNLLIMNIVFIIAAAAFGVIRGKSVEMTVSYDDA